MERAGRFYFRHLLLPLAAVLLIALWINVGRVDLRVADSFFDPLAMRFPLHDQSLFALSALGIEKAVMTTSLAVTAALTIAALMIPGWRPFWPAMLYMLLALALATVAVQGLNYLVDRHCPYELAIYGGTVPYLAGLQRAAAVIPAGHCWPSARATTGFALFGLYFAVRWLGHRRLALVLLGAVLALGILLGGLGVAGGEDFPSYDLWSAVVCWLVSLILYESLLRHRKFEGLP